MSARRQVVAYLVLLGALAIFWFGFEHFAQPILFLFFGVAFAAAAILIVDVWRKVFALGKKGANNVDP